MSRALLFAAALAGALLLAALVSLPPAPRPADAPAGTFSAERAMADVRAVSRAPHPTGSAENARVRAYLLDRLRSLGLETSTLAAPLAAPARERLAAWGERDVPAGVDVIGRLRGGDPSQPAVVLMAHYDTVSGSPGAADDGAGVAAVLEIVRALRAGSAPRRDLVVVLTDAEELDLDGARAFFDRHPLAPRTGAVVNLEARGAGGRALMFETGPDAGGMTRLFRRAVAHPAAHSLAVLIYRLMPNSSDFTLVRGRGLAGFNFAFMGAPGLYHSPLATPDRLSARSLQHIGGQALDVTRALVSAQALPAPAPDAVFSDVLGLFLLAYPPWAGWLVAGATAALLAFAAVRAAGAGRLEAAGVIGGAVRAWALLLHAALLLEALNRLSGAGAGADYFDRLAAVPRLEAQAALAGLAVLVAGLAWARPARRLLAAVPAALLSLACLLFGPASPALLVLGGLAAGTALVLPRTPRRGAAGWLGALALLFVAALAVQAIAPTAAPILAWPVLVAAVAAATAVGLDPHLERPTALVVCALAALLAGAQALAMAHLAFLGVGADLAPAMAPFVLILAALAWPLAPGRGGRILTGLAAIALLASLGLALSVRLDPPAASVPAWLQAEPQGPAPG